MQEKIERFDQYPDFVRFLFEDVPLPEGADPEACGAAAAKLETLADWSAPTIEEALRALAD